jgi:Ca2+-binding EF-hand superfamily protein
MTLSQEDITACREAFNKFDKDGSGTVRVQRVV